jgi:hypothetical protein
MKDKLTYYLEKECEKLNEVLMQTKEIKKSIESDDIDYANKLFVGRSKNILKANSFQKAVIKIVERSTGTPVLKDGGVIFLRGKVVSMLREIKSLDDEISEILFKEYADSKEGYKKAKELNLLKKSYIRTKSELLPKLLDEKT